MKLLTWNIQWGRGIDGRVDLGRTAARIADFGGGADIVCLQEVAVSHTGLPGMTPQDGAGDDQAARLAEYFPGYAHVFGAGSDLPDATGAGRRLFGQMILSRLPLLQVFRHLLPWPADPAVPSMQRVAVEAVVAVPGLLGGALRVVTTHLEYYSASQRAAQIEFLRELQAGGHRHAVAPRSDKETDSPFAVLPRGEFAVFCGDFNSPAASPEHARMQAPICVGVPRLVDTWDIAHPATPHAPTAGVHAATFTAGPEAYDFFFVSDNLAPRVTSLAVDLETDASDHQPVLLGLN